MSNNVIPFNNITRLDITVERVLDAAKDQVTEGVVVLGWDENECLYFNTSIADGGEVLWLLEKAKQAMLTIPPND